MIISSVPVFLETLRRLSPEDKAKLAPVSDLVALTFGYRLNALTYEIEMGVWRKHYGEKFSDPASKIDALTRWRTDLRKLSLPSAHLGDYQVNRVTTGLGDMLAESEHRDLPTAWARILGDD